MPEDRKITPLASRDPALLRNVASLTILAWGREPSTADIDLRAAALQQELSVLDPNRRALFIARDGTAVVAFGRAARDDSAPSHWWLLALVVHPDYRCQGIGRAMADARIAYAREHGATTIRSETHADNLPSIAYHEAIGFTNDGPFTAEDGDHKIASHLTLVAV